MKEKHRNDFVISNHYTIRSCKLSLSEGYVGYLEGSYSGEQSRQKKHRIMVKTEHGDAGRPQEHSLKSCNDGE